MPGPGPQRHSLQGNINDHLREHFKNNEIINSTQKNLNSFETSANLSPFMWRENSDEIPFQDIVSSEFTLCMCCTELQSELGMNEIPSMYFNKDTVTLIQGSSRCQFNIKDKGFTYILFLLIYTPFKSK